MTNRFMQDRQPLTLSSLRAAPRTLTLGDRQPSDRPLSTYSHRRNHEDRSPTRAPMGISSPRGTKAGRTGDTGERGLRGTCTKCNPRNKT
jgi:hypothetical protein